MEDGVLVYVEL